MPRNIGSYLKDLDLDLSIVESITIDHQKKGAERYILHLKHNSKPIKLVDFIIDALNKKQAGQLEAYVRPEDLAQDVDAIKLKNDFDQKVEALKIEYKNKPNSDKEFQEKLKLIEYEYFKNLKEISNKFPKKMRDKISDALQRIITEYVKKNESIPKPPEENVKDNILFNIRQLKRLKVKLEPIIESYENEIIFYNADDALYQTVSILPAGVIDFILSSRSIAPDIFTEDVLRKAKKAHTRSLITKITSQDFSEKGDFEKYVISPDDTFQDIIQKLKIQEANDLPCLFEGKDLIHEKNDAVNELCENLSKRDDIKIEDFKLLLESNKIMSHNKSKIIAAFFKILSNKENNVEQTTAFLRHLSDPEKFKPEDRKAAVEAFYSSISLSKGMNLEKLNYLFNFIDTYEKNTGISKKKSGLTKTEALNQFYTALELRTDLTLQDVEKMFNFTYLGKKGKFSAKEKIGLDKEKISQSIQKSLEKRDNLTMGEISDFLVKFKANGHSIAKGIKLINGRMKTELESLTEVASLLKQSLSKLQHNNLPSDPNEQLLLYKNLKDQLRRFHKLSDSYQTLKNKDMIPKEKLLPFENIIKGINAEMTQVRSEKLIESAIDQEIKPLYDAQNTVYSSQVAKIRSIEQKVHKINFKDIDDTLNTSRNNYSSDTFLKDLQDAISKLDTGLTDLNSFESDIKNANDDIGKLSQYRDVSEARMILDTIQLIKQQKQKDISQKLQILINEQEKVLKFKELVASSQASYRSFEDNFHEKTRSLSENISPDESIEVINAKIVQLEAEGNAAKSLMSTFKKLNDTQGSKALVKNLDIDTDLSKRILTESNLDDIQKRLQQSITKLESHYKDKISALQNMIRLKQYNTEVIEPLKKEADALMEKLTSIMPTIQNTETDIQIIQESQAVVSSTKDYSGLEKISENISQAKQNSAALVEKGNAIEIAATSFMEKVDALPALDRAQFDSMIENLSTKYLESNSQLTKITQDITNLTQHQEELTTQKSEAAERARAEEKAKEEERAAAEKEASRLRAEAEARAAAEKETARLAAEVAEQARLRAEAEEQTRLAAAAVEEARLAAEAQAQAEKQAQALAEAQARAEAQAQAEALERARIELEAKKLAEEQARVAAEQAREAQAEAERVRLEVETAAQQETERRKAEQLAEKQSNLASVETQEPKQKEAVTEKTPLAASEPIIQTSTPEPSRTEAVVPKASSVAAQVPIEKAPLVEPGSSTIPPSIPQPLISETVTPVASNESIQQHPLHHLAAQFDTLEQNKEKELQQAKQSEAAKAILISSKPDKAPIQPEVQPPAPAKTAPSQGPILEDPFKVIKNSIDQQYNNGKKENLSNPIKILGSADTASIRAEFEKIYTKARKDKPGLFTFARLGRDTERTKQLDQIATAIFNFKANPREKEYSALQKCINKIICNIEAKEPTYIFKYPSALKDLCIEIQTKLNELDPRPAPKKERGHDL